MAQMGPNLQRRVDPLEPVIFAQARAPEQR